MRPEEGFQVAADPGGNGAFAVDGPGKHGAAVDMLYQTRQLCGVTFAELAGDDRFVEELSGFFADGAELRERDGVKIGVGQIDLEIGEAVGHGFGRCSKAGTFREQFDQCLKR